MALNEQKEELANLVGKWTKGRDAVIAVPLFKVGVLDRERHKALRAEAAEAWLRVDNFLYERSEGQ